MAHDLYLCLIYVSVQYLHSFINVSIFLHLPSISWIIHSERERDSILQLHYAIRQLEILKLEQMVI